MKKCIALTLVFLFYVHGHAEEKEKPQKKCDDARFWAEGEYICWWIKHSPEPVPLITEGPVVPNLAPVLGEPGQRIVLGDKNVNLGAHSGARLSMGGWFKESDVGLEGNYFFLPEASKKSSVSSNGETGSPFFALPFKDATTDLESSTRISNPGEFAGFASLKIRNDMVGAEADILGRVYCKGPTNFSLLGGFRWWNFNEKLSFETSSPNISAPFDIVQTSDIFSVRNNFYGGQLGFDARFTWKWFSFQTIAKIALGAMDSKVKIKGQLETNYFDDFGAVETFSGGYFALPTNEGKTTRTRFSLLPEANVNLGFQLVDWMRLDIGYTFMYVTNVVGAGNTIDREINPSQAPAIMIDSSATLVGVALPKPLLKTEDLWVQGVSVGLNFGY